MCVYVVRYFTIRDKPLTLTSFTAMIIIPCNKTLRLSFMKQNKGNIQPITYFLKQNLIYEDLEILLNVFQSPLGLESDCSNLREFTILTHTLRFIPHWLFLIILMGNDRKKTISYICIHCLSGKLKCKPKNGLR